MKLAVPYHEQKTEYTCGPASLKMFFSFLGTFKTEEKIARHASTDNETGTRHQGMIDAALHQKFYCYVNADSSVDEIRYFINLGLPVIIDYTEPTEEEGHYAVVSGYTNGNIILHDPWNGENFKLKENDLVMRWHDSHSGYKSCTRWMMVLSTEAFSLGKQYIPRVTE